MRFYPLTIIILLICSCSFNSEKWIELEPHEFSLQTKILKIQNPGYDTIHTTPPDTGKIAAYFKPDVIVYKIFTWKNETITLQKNYRSKCDTVMQFQSMSKLEFIVQISNDSIEVSTREAVIDNICGYDQFEDVIASISSGYLIGKSKKRKY